MLEEGDHESIDSCRMREVEGVGTVELVCVGTLLRMGCDSFLMHVCGSIGGGELLWKQNGLPWEHSVENKWAGGGGGGRGRDKKFNSVGGRGRGEAETQSLNLWLVVPELLVGGWWWRESYSGIAGNTYFVYLALRTSALGMGQTVTLGKRNTLCCKSGMEIYFYLVL